MTNMKMPTEEELLEMMFNQLLPQMVIVQHFAPHMDPEMFPQVAMQCAKQQLDIDKNIIPTFLDPEKIKSHPLIHIIVETEDKHGNKGDATFPAYKRLEDTNGDPQLAIASAVALAFLMNPLPRAILMMHGFKFRFVQTNDPGKVSIIQ